MSGCFAFSINSLLRCEYSHAREAASKSGLEEGKVAPLPWLPARAAVSSSLTVLRARHLNDDRCAPVNICSRRNEHVFKGGYLYLEIAGNSRRPLNASFAPCFPSYLSGSNPTVIRATRYLRPRAGHLNSSPQRPVSPHLCRVWPTNEAVTPTALQWKGRLSRRAPCGRLTGDNEVYRRPARLAP